jgi:putative ABC transport system substrate-binding protein
MHVPFRQSLLINNIAKLLVLVTVCLASWPLLAHAQTRPVQLIGVLGDVPPSAPILVEFRQALSEAGYIEGRNIAFEIKSAGGVQAQLPMLAAELVERQPAVIVTFTSIASALAAKAASTEIPIVFANACRSCAVRTRCLPQSTG